MWRGYLCTVYGGQKTALRGRLFLSTFVWVHREHFNRRSLLACFCHIFLISLNSQSGSLLSQGQAWRVIESTEESRVCGVGSRRTQVKRKWNVFSVTQETFLLVFFPQHHGFLNICSGPGSLRVQREVRNCPSLCRKPLLLCVVWYSLDWAVPDLLKPGFKSSDIKQEPWAEKTPVGCSQGAHSGFEWWSKPSRVVGSVTKEAHPPEDTVLSSYLLSRREETADGRISSFFRGS